MSDDDSGSDFDPRPSGSTSKCARRRSTRATAAANASISAASVGAADSKRKRRIVMRIEFDDDDDDDDEETSASDNSVEEEEEERSSTSSDSNSNADDLDERPSCSTQKRQQPRRGAGGKPKQQPQAKQTRAAVIAAEEDSTEEFQLNGGASSSSRRLRNRAGPDLSSSNSSSDGSSSGSEINRRVKTRGKKSKKYVISEDEREHKSPSKQVNNQTQQQQKPEEAGFSSDSSSNELLEKCPICLLTFRQQEIGSPATCAHIFCAACIEAWSRNVQTCPIDRLEFDRIIVRESYENRKIVREIKIDPNKSKKELMLNDDDDVVVVSDAEEMTNCEICESAEREDVMLLCDSCNQGYHIDCLTPALEHIPEGSWYCDNCFDSEEEGSDEAVEEDLNMLYEDIRDMGIPSARVTEVHQQPRILRTRQNERIRAAILRRTRGATATTTTTEETTISTTTRGRGRPRIARAGAAESAAATTRTTTTTRTTRTRTTRRRRRRARQRTYVVEYDLNNFDQKFAIKTTKKIVRRRRKRKTRKVPKRHATSTRGVRKRLAEQLGLKKSGCNSHLPGAAAVGGSLSLFGNTNDLEYFSGDSDNGGGLDTEIQIDTGHGTAVQTSVRISSFGSNAQRARKGLLLGRLERNSASRTSSLVAPMVPAVTPSNPDLLSSLMDMQDRWHNATRNLENVHINADGTLNLGGQSSNTTTETPNNPRNADGAEEGVNAQNPSPSDITQAPMYPRGGGGGNSNFNRGGGGRGGGGGGGGGSAGGGYNNRYSNQTNYRGGGGGGGSGGGGNQYRHSTGGMNSSGGGGGGNFNNMGASGNFNNNNNPNFNPNQNPNFSPFNPRFNQRNQQNNNNNNNNQRNNNNNNQRHSLPFNVNNRNDIIPPQQPQQQNSSFNQQPQHPPPLAPQFDNSLFSGLPPPVAPQLNESLFSGLPPPIIVPIVQPTPNLQTATGGGGATPASTIPALMSIPPPPAPPPGVQMPWNSSLFKLNADYGNDDDDSNCPNFSVYSAESQEVAKSTDINKTGNEGEAPKEDDENEDLVQLDDDDDIPMPPESDDTPVESSADLYEPENPTEENDDAEQDQDDNGDDQITDATDGGGILGTESKSNDDAQYDPEQETISQINSIDEEESNNADAEILIQKDDEEDTKSNNNDVEVEEKVDEEKSEDADKRSPSPAVSEIKLPESEASVANRKGVLELYDDSDWEELDIDKPKGSDKNVDDKKEKNKSQTEATNDDGAPEQDRSYTPCLDENNDPEEPAVGGTPQLNSSVGTHPNAVATEGSGDGEKSPNNADETAGIAGMETEWISDDEENSRGRNKRRNDKRDRDRRGGNKDNNGETFKKVSNKQKERNYRSDKPTTTNRRNDRQRVSSRSRSRSKSKSKSRSRSRSRSARGRKRSRSFRSRSRSNNKENQGWRHGRFGGGDGRGRGRGGRRFQNQRQQRPKRRELPRYDVRHVIGTQQRFDRNAKDRYGRDTSRQPRSRSGSRGRIRQRSFSRSHSLSGPPKRNRRCSFSMSPSPTAASAAAGFNRQSVSPPPLRRFNSPRRRSRSLGGDGGGRRPSPVHRQHSRSPLRMKTRSLSPAHRMNGRKVTRMMRDGSPLPHVSQVSRSRSPLLSVSPRYTPRMSRTRSKSPLMRQKGKKRKIRDKKKKKKKRPSSISPEPNRRISRQRDMFELEKPPLKKKRRHSPKSKISVDEPGTWSPSPSPPPLHDYPPPRENNVSWTPPIVSPHAGGGGDVSADIYEPDMRRSSSKASKKEKRKRGGGKPKKKKAEKRRETRKDKRRQRRTETPEPAPSKEVFASGNNILVSVSFNKEGASSNALAVNQTQQQQQQTTVVTLPPNREDLHANRRTSVDRLTNNSTNKKNKKDKTHKRKKLDTKPVAIIDLERSPFQVHQEPADIIILTDSEDANDALDDGPHHEHRRGGSDRRRSESRGAVENNDHHQQQRNQMGGGSNGRASSSQHDKTPPMERLDTILEESYDIPLTGPKTPPEPPSIKFNILPKKQNKVRNPLHEEADLNSETDIQERREEHEQQQQQHRQDMDTMHGGGGGGGAGQSSQKIGPNTPPESGPCSPDAYDPFEPTKSPSMSPRSPTPPPMDVSQTSIGDSTDVGVSSSASQKHLMVERERLSGERERTVGQQIPGVGGSGNGNGVGVGNSQAIPLNPVELVMALMNSKANSSQDLANKSNESQFSNSSHMLSTGVGSSSHDDSLRDMRDKSEEGNGVTVLSNLLISTGSQQQSQHIPSISSPTPPISKSNQIMKLPLPKVGGSVGSSSGGFGSSNLRNGGGGGGADDSFNMDIESPYSPGSADYEDLFEPPPDTSSAKRRHKRGGGKVEQFDNLFGSSSPVGHLRLPSYTPSTKKNKTGGAGNRKSRKGKSTTTDDHKMYDDVPNSAVDLQVKDKFLRKLNRQERVVEEVKLVLKPRFNKKQITKDDYKDIMRRAVPKICHSRTGEINPHKIKNLVEAYVKKFRAKHKKLNIINTGQVSGAVKCAAYLKKL